MIYSRAIDIDQLIPGCKNFTWRESLWLHTWNFASFPNPQQMDNIVAAAAKMELIRAFLGNKSINVTSWLRPEIYNKTIGGAAGSVHPLGMAVDFEVAGMLPNDVRTALQPKLDEFVIRMENLPNSTWTHIDIKDPGPNGHRFFIP